MSLPGVIRRLDTTVVNRIAAGEVIQRPSNALKELLENSLDAKSTNIQIMLKSGGLKVLQIQDNGTGIKKDDMSIVCERFTTSKLTEFEDLNSISTFGFRGEALASISHVAHLSIVTKTANEQCAYKAMYEDGKLKEPPKACAGNQGTQITVEDLFFNVSTRRKALKNASDEHNRAVEMVSRYAVHNPLVGFNLKKDAMGLAEIRTPCGSTCVDNIKILFGNAVARDLLHINTTDEGLKLRLSGYITNVNYSAKKLTFLLFINDRLVDCTGLRKALDSVYRLFLPKGAYPFVYISLALDPSNVDVNVHPTKHEVHFLHEDSIIEKIRLIVEGALNEANTSRTFQTQIKTPALSNLQQITGKSTSTAPSHMVRTDSSTQKLEKFFNSVSATNPALSPSTSKSGEASDAATNAVQRRKIKLHSVLKLRKEIEDNEHAGLREVLADMTFVGTINEHSALIQHKDNLYICNTSRIAEEMFYQIMVYEFGNFGKVKFTNGLSIIDLCKVGLENPKSNEGYEVEDKDFFANTVMEHLKSKGPMLEDYFSIVIDKNGILWSIPLLLEDYELEMGALPNYIIQLGRQVNWEDEEQCFRDICRFTAKLYSNVAVSTLSYAGNDWQWTNEHVVYSTIKNCMYPPKKFADDDTFDKAANITELYKIFERC